MNKQNNYIKIEPVLEVNTSTTIRMIPEGATARLDRKTYGTETSMRAICTRYNKEAGWKKYSLRSIDRGDYFDITNNAKS